MILKVWKSDGQKVKLRNSNGRFRGQFLDMFCGTFLENIAQTVLCLILPPLAASRAIRYRTDVVWRRVMGGVEDQYRDTREEKVPKLRASLPCRVESSI